MFLVANLLEAFARILDVALGLYTWVIIIRALLSWVNPDPYNPLVRILSAFTEPVFSWFRRRLPLVAGGFDLSPLVVIGAIYLMNYLVTSSLVRVGLNLKLKGGL